VLLPVADAKVYLSAVPLPLLGRSHGLGQAQVWARKLLLRHGSDQSCEWLDAARAFRCNEDPV
jgi:hypothetical protein